MEARRRTPFLSAEAFARYDPGECRSELVHGQVVREPLPVYGHAALQLRLGMLLQAHLDAAGLPLRCIGPAGFITERVPDTVRGPDLAVVSLERVGDGTGFIEGAPELAIEILSPSERVQQIRAKVAEYPAAGGREVWLLDPRRQTLTVHRAGEVAARYGRGDVFTGSAVLPHFELELASLFDQGV